MIFPRIIELRLIVLIFIHKKKVVITFPRVNKHFVDDVISQSFSFNTDVNGFIL